MAQQTILAVLVGAAGMAASVHAQTQMWMRQFGTIADESGVAVAPGSPAEIYTFIGGHTRGSLGGPFAGGASFGDAWLGMVNNNGLPIWTRQLGTSVEEATESAAPDGAGGVFAAGWTDGALIAASAGGRDAWLVRYDRSGNQLWARQFGTAGSDVIFAAASDGAGGVFVSGYTSGALGGPHAGGFSDTWLARYDAAGNRLWIRQFGSGGNDSTAVATPDGAGGVFLGGYTTGNLGAPPLGGNDAWVARYDAAGNRLWIRQFGTSHVNGDVTTALAEDGAGGVFAAGYTGGSFGGLNAGGTDIWLLRYDAAGSQYWPPRQFGTSAAENPTGAASDRAGGVFLVGTTAGSLGGPSAGSNDIWLTRHDGTGAQVWAGQFGTSASDGCGDAVSDGDGGILITGYTNGNLPGNSNAGGTDVLVSWFALPGACCLPGNGCNILDPTTCYERGGVFRGGNTTCATANCPCYGNCDTSTAVPVLNINDFVCFSQRFVAGDPWANCDGSTQPPILNVLDYACFLNGFASGCP